MADCGDSVTLETHGKGLISILGDDFNDSSLNSGFNVNGTPDLSEPCQAAPDSTPYLWMGPTTNLPRYLATDDTNATSAQQICFDIKMNNTIAGTSPCDGPDQPDEGISLQYSTDNGSSWSEILYLNPDTLIDFSDWEHFCIDVPGPAKTDTTRFRWKQLNASGSNYDHWGLDDVYILKDSSNLVFDWGNGTSDRRDSSFVPNDTSNYSTTIIDTVQDDTCTANAYVGYRPLEAEIEPMNPTKCGNDSLKLSAGTNGGGCDYILAMTDSGGSGWDGAYITAFIDGDSISKHSPSGFSSQDTISLFGLDTLSLAYHSGSNDGENSYMLISPSGDTLFQDGPPPQSGLVYTESFTCDSPGNYSYDWSPGSTLSDSLNAVVSSGTNTPIAYALTVQDIDHSFCSDSDTVQVDTASAPDPGIVSDSGFCEYDADTLSLSSNYNWTVWNDNLPGDSLLADSGFGTGTQEHWVTVKDSNGCAGSDTVQLSVWPAPDPSITADSSFCADGSDTLTLASSYDSTLWNGSVSGDSLIIDSSYGMPTQTHSVSVIDSNGCSGFNSVQVAVSSVNASIWVQDDTLRAGSSSASYQWVDCDSSYTPVSGATSQSFYPSSNGSYAVILDQSGCKDTSDCKSSLPNSVWNNQGGGIPASLYSVELVDSTRGWVVSGNGKIFHTPDGGAGWNVQLDTSLALHSISFGNDSTGWAVGDSGIVLFTNDGGSNWVTQAPGVSDALYSVHAVDGSNAWASGSNSALIHTMNGGGNWSAQTSGTSVDLNAIFFLDQDTGWSVGSNGTIIRSTDGGANWASQTSGTSNDLHDLQIMNDTVGWTVGDNGTILLTEDGGTTWTSQLSGTSEDLEAVHFVNDSTGYVVGANGTMLYTTNARSGWFSQADGNFHSLRDISFTQAHQGWAVGDGGTVLRLRGGSGSPSAIGAHEKERLVRVYPNPVEHRLQVEHRAFEGRMTLSLYNNIGQRLKTRTLNGSTRGMTAFEVSELGSGIYFLKIQGEGEHGTFRERVRKIVVE